MPCCGNKRAQAATQPLRVNAALAQSFGRQQVIVPDQVRYRYDGHTTLTVVGPISRTHYRFAFPGAVLDVDTRDAPAFMALPHLRRIRD